MKVSNIGSAKSAGRTRGKKVSDAGGDFADHLKGPESADETGSTVETPGVGGVEGMLAAQEVPDALDPRSRKQSIDHGELLLDRLERMRLRLLEGSIPKEELAELARMLRARRRDESDPRLKEIIDEIELRAEVEIAKLTRGM